MSVYTDSSLLRVTQPTSNTSQWTNADEQSAGVSIDFGAMLHAAAAKTVPDTPSSFVATGTLGREHHATCAATIKIDHYEEQDVSSHPRPPSTNSTTQISADNVSAPANQQRHLTSSDPVPHNFLFLKDKAASHDARTTAQVATRLVEHPGLPMSAATSLDEALPSDVHDSATSPSSAAQLLLRQSTSAPFSVSFHLADGYLQVRLTLQASTPEERSRLRNGATQLLADYNWQDVDLHIAEGHYPNPRYAKKEIGLGS